MIRATVSFWYCFCWLYWAAPSLTAKDIINLISILTRYLLMPMCSVISCVVRRGCLLWLVCSFGKTVSLCPASFCTPRSNVPVTPVLSWIPTFAWKELLLWWKEHLFLVLVLEGLIGLHRTVNFGLFGISGWGIDLDYILSFLKLHPSNAFQTLLLTMRAAPFFLRDSYHHTWTK